VVHREANVRAVRRALDSILKRSRAGFQAFRTAHLLRRCELPRTFSRFPADVILSKSTPRLASREKLLSVRRCLPSMIVFKTLRFCLICALATFDYSISKIQSTSVILFVDFVSLLFSWSNQSVSNTGNAAKVSLGDQHPLKVTTNQSIGGLIPCSKPLSPTSVSQTGLHGSLLDLQRSLMRASSV